MLIINFPQGSQEWRVARAGRVTASRVADVLAKTKTGPGASRANYLAELVAERLTGLPTDGYVNAAMQHGTENEPKARQLYELLHDVEVRQVGLVRHSTMEGFAASPDGLVGDHLIEIKCPQTATHLDYLLTEKVPGKYFTQMQAQMACCPRAEYCDFISYDPRLSGDMQLWTQRVYRDEKFIRDMEAAIASFLDEVAETVAKLQAKYGVRAAA